MNKKFYTNFHSKIKGARYTQINMASKLQLHWIVSRKEPFDYLQLAIVVFYSRRYRIYSSISCMRV